MEQGQRRPFRQDQPPHRRTDARKGAAGRPSPAAALLAGHAQRRESDDHARRAAGARQERRRIRRLADRHRRRRPIRSGFVAVNPNSKIPALLDRSGAAPIRVFESGAILLYLTEKFGAFLPTEAASAPSACRGCSGRSAARPISAAASAISTPTRRRRSNMRSTASRWR